MSKFHGREDDFFFELRSGPSRTNGQHVRYFVLVCRKCSTEISLQAHGMGTAKIRKWFKRHGWDVGKMRNQHTCPDCQRKHEKHIAEHGGEDTLALNDSPKPPPSPLVQCDFCDKMNDQVKKMVQGCRAYICNECITLCMDIIHPSTECHIVTAPGILAVAEGDAVIKHVQQATIDEQGFQHGAHIDSMPIEARPSEIEHPIQVTKNDDESVEADSQISDADNEDDVADWWKELHAQK